MDIKEFVRHIDSQEEVMELLRELRDYMADAHEANGDTFSKVISNKLGNLIEHAIVAKGE